jgi:2-phosphosulfolactate phosphatase
VRLDVAFTPEQAREAPIGVVVDVLRAGSTIVQALDSGYQRVLCCAEVDDAFALREELGQGVLAGERLAALIPGFDLGNSPRDVLEPLGDTLILTTTNGTRAIAAAARRCQTVYVGTLLNLEAVAALVNAKGEDVTVFCAGVDGEYALDDAYCAGRIAALLGGDRTDRAEEAVAVTRSFGSASEALASLGNPRQAGLVEDIAWCSRESVSQVVPTVAGARGGAVELRPA